MDLRSATYDQFVSLVFDHDPEDEVADKWYWKNPTDVQIEPRRAVEYLTNVFLGGQDLLASYTDRQITEGLGYLLGAGASEFRDQLWNADVPWQERQRCIAAIPKIYADVLERDSDAAASCAYMLWDWIVYDYSCGNRDPASNNEDARVQDAMFEALRLLLESNHPNTQIGAVHGLGHLSHRDSARTIQKFLASDRPADERVRKYAAQVLEGEFQ